MQIHINATIDATNISRAMPFHLSTKFDFGFIKLTEEPFTI